MDNYLTPKNYKIQVRADLYPLYIYPPPIDY